MATIAAIKAKFENFGIDHSIRQSFVETTAGFTEEQKRQLYQGLNKEGKKFQKYKSDAYAKKKNSLNTNPGFGNPDLFLTGAFYAGVKVSVQGDGVQVESTDEKGPKLIEKYNPFGLGTTFKQEYIKNSLQPAFRQELREKTGL